MAMLDAGTGKRCTRALIVTLLVIVLGGCQALTRERPKPDSPEFSPAAPEAMMGDEPVNGSIYQSSRNLNPFSDSTALNVGDMVTVQLQERTTASKTSTTEIDKDSEAEVATPLALGREPSPDLSTNVEAEREFEGEASADQSNQLAGEITVSVVEVLPNGVLRVRGEKWLSLTQGEEYVRLKGLIRQEDIGSDNTITSNRIADARISYGGTGDFDQSNRMGWFTRLLNSEWFPL